VTERFYKRLMRIEQGGGPPDTDAIRAARINVRYHIAYIGWLVRTRDWLAGDRLSLADLAAAAHVSVADPTCADLRAAVAAAARSTDVRLHDGGTYVCIEGPQFSSRAESLVYRSWGVDVIGMTNAQEAKLAREAEICYVTVAMVTDYDCWHQDHDAVTAEQIMGVLGRNAETARKVLRAAVRRLPIPRGCECATALKYALITPKELVPEAVKRELEPIVGRYLK